MNEVTAEPIMVSIYCLAYKHEKYLRQTLDGFINQKTNFKYEIIVHDDASNDGTKEIIEEYYSKYPEIIIPIVQKENQYSKKIEIVTKYILPCVHGKYIAVCEGDDYWTDCDKLQMQVDALEENPDCHMSVHKVMEVNKEGVPTGVYYPEKVNTGKLTSEEFVNMQVYYSFQTSSFLFRGDIWREMRINPPEFKRLFPVGDVAMMLYFGNAGNVYYIDRIMSCYRRGVSTSYTSRTKQANDTIEKQNAFSQRFIDALVSFDDYSNGRFHSFCVKKIALYMGGMALLSGNVDDLLLAGNKEFYDALDIKRKFMIRMTRFAPKMAQKIFVFRRKLQAKRHHV